MPDSPPLALAGKLALHHHSRLVTEFISFPTEIVLEKKIGINERPQGRGATPAVLTAFRVLGLGSPLRLFRDGIGDPPDDLRPRPRPPRTSWPPAWIQCPV